MPKELFTIGRFGRLCRLSVKQLRHYDELGLLRPVEVDPFTGYRYYAAAQARDALTIALLRDIDIALPVIAEVLTADGAGREAILRRERDRLADHIARDRQRLALLGRLADGRVDSHEVTAATEPVHHLWVASGSCEPAGIGAQVAACIGRLIPAVTAAGGPVASPLWGLFPIDLTEVMTVSVGVTAGLTETPTGLESRTLPATRVAATTHHGPYSQLPLAYHALLAWIHERGFIPQGPAREGYLVTPGEAADDELVTTVHIPFIRETAKENR